MGLTNSEFWANTRFAPTTPSMKGKDLSPLRSRACVLTRDYSLRDNGERKGLCIKRVQACSLNQKRRSSMIKKLLAVILALVITVAWIGTNYAQQSAGPILRI